MNSDFAILVAPLGCFTRSGTSHTFQRETQSYQRDGRPTDQLHQRKRLVRAILSVRRFTPEVDQMIRCHLRAFDLRDTWCALPEDRRLAASMTLYKRVRMAAVGRANGTAAFSGLLGEGTNAAPAAAGGKDHV